MKKVAAALGVIGLIAGSAVPALAGPPEPSGAYHMVTNLSIAEGGALQGDDRGDYTGNDLYSGFYDRFDNASDANEDGRPDSDSFRFSPWRYRDFSLTIGETTYPCEGQYEALRFWSTSHPSWFNDADSTQGDALIRCYARGYQQIVTVEYRSEDLEAEGTEECVTAERIDEKTWTISAPEFVPATEGEEQEEPSGEEPSLLDTIVDTVTGADEEEPEHEPDPGTPASGCPALVTVWEKNKNSYDPIPFEDSSVPFELQATHQ